VLASTNRDLKAAVDAGTFRQDLFYRLNVFPIHLPSLRERVDDILLLAEYLIDRYAKKASKKFRDVTSETLELFQAYEWPGNIRELQNVIERAVILCDGETFSIDETWLKRESPPESGSNVPLVPTLVEREKEMIETALAQCQGRVSGPFGAAKSWESRARPSMQESPACASTSIDLRPVSRPEAGGAFSSRTLSLKVKFFNKGVPQCQDLRHQVP
jgi:formate hydrogenlyase transcriptional activator